MRNEMWQILYCILKHIVNGKMSWEWVPSSAVWDYMALKSDLKKIDCLKVLPFFFT